MIQALRIEAIIPAHNEVETIHAVVTGLKPFGLQRILVVDDASDDGTGEAARKAGADVVRLEPGKGGGKGQVMQAGLRAIGQDDFDYYLFLDGDGQHDPADLQRFLDRLEQEPDLDFLVGSRKQEAHRIPKKRWRTNALGTWTLGRIAGVRWEDSQSGFRLVKKKILDRMVVRGAGFTFEMETAMKAAHYRIRWAHVPIQAIYHEEGGGSHFRGAMDTWLIAWFSLWC
jgi:glycosyltransferase involved in cell wall biosynthesis